LSLQKSERPAHTPAIDFAAFAAEHRLRIGHVQLKHLSIIATDRGPLCRWTRGLEVAPNAVVVVDDVLNPPQVHALRRTLGPEGLVILPFGESPAFDYLKSTLRSHGVIGATAPDSPHQIWWGGRTVAAPAGWYENLLRSHVVTCVKPNSEGDLNAPLFAKGLDIVGISYAIERDEGFGTPQESRDLRSRLLLAAWEQTEKPLVWLDPSGTVDLKNIALNIPDADFAVVPTTAGFSTNLLYFGRSQAAHDLLTCWHNLAIEFPRLPASYLLDTAWALVSAQRPLVTQWLAPQVGSASKRDMSGCPPQAIEHLMLTSTAQNQARKAGRTGAPEPHCIIKSRFDGHGPLMLIVTTEGLARDIATTVESAIDAFDEADGGFSSLGIVICQNQREIGEALRLASQGWVLYALPGLTFDPHVFRTLASRLHGDRPEFIYQESYGQRHTATGIALQATRAKAVFGTIASFKTWAAATTRQTSLLKLVADRVFYSEPA